MNYEDFLTRNEPGSTQVRINSGVAFSVYEFGTSTLVTSGVSGTDGKITITDITNGKYDIKVDGEIVKSFEIVTVDYAEKHPESWQVHIAGTISGDSDESPNVPVFAQGRAGVIERIQFIVEHIDATGDVTVHILKGVAGGAAALAVATDSAYNKQIAPGSEQYNAGSPPDVTNIAVAANEAVTVGIDYTAGTVEGLTVVMIFKPDE